MKGERAIARAAVAWWLVVTDRNVNEVTRGKAYAELCRELRRATGKGKP